jgi:hypothetical protein
MLRGLKDSSNKLHEKTPFSNTSSPMFVTAFRTPEDFKKANQLIA